MAVSRLRVASFSISIDGFGAGPDQSLAHPMGVGGQALHGWAFETRTFRQMFGEDGGSTDVGDAFARRGIENIGAWNLGRNMFGPLRGPWPDESWNGRWGETPPYHTPVFVLTHHPRTPLMMDGGTTFYFVTDGIRSALDQAKEAAGKQDVRVGGGVATVREYLRAGAIDEMHLAISPVVLGSCENLFADLDLAKLGFRCTEHVPTASATHVVLTRENCRRHCAFRSSREPPVPSHFPPPSEIR